MNTDAHPHDQVTVPISEQGSLLLETRPQRLIAARYDKMPFPNIGPHQEVAFDLGITAQGADIELSGVVFRGYHGHQLLFEQRWPACVIRRHTGEENLTIGDGTGLALRSLHFMLHGHEDLSFVEVVALGKRPDGETVQAKVQAPVVYHTQQTDLHFPLRGAWWTIQAGDWSDQHKVEVFSQSYALDFVKLGSDNQFFRNNGRTLADHYSWDQPVYAAAGGKVAYVCYDMPDLTPGILPDMRIFRGDARRLLGNALAISHANGEFSYYAHLQQASIEVNEGAMIRRGTRLARVGNSGQSPGPHLHFHLMEGPNLFIDQGLPCQFSHLSVGGEFFTEPIYVPTRAIVIRLEENGDAAHER